MVECRFLDPVGLVGVIASVGDQTQRRGAPVARFFPDDFFGLGQFGGQIYEAFGIRQIVHHHAVVCGKDVVADVFYELEKSGVHIGTAVEERDLLSGVQLVEQEAGNPVDHGNS